MNIKLLRVKHCREEKLLGNSFWYLIFISVLSKTNLKLFATAAQDNGIDNEDETINFNHNPDDDDEIQLCEDEGVDLVAELELEK